MVDPKRTDSKFTGKLAEVDKKDDGNKKDDRSEKSSSMIG